MSLSSLSSLLSSSSALFRITHYKLNNLTNHFCRFFGEILAKNANKASALRAAIERLDDLDSLADLAAFGDGNNDAEMLGAVGCGVAVANARDKAKKAATVVSRFSNGQAAVAREIQALVRDGRFGAAVAGKWPKAGVAFPEGVEATTEAGMS